MRAAGRRIIRTRERPRLGAHEAVISRLRPLGEIVQRCDTRHNRSKRYRNFRISRVGPMLFAVDSIAVNLSVERVCNLTGRAGEFEHALAFLGGSTWKPCDASQLLTV